MKGFAVLLLALATATPATAQRQFLVSIVDLPIGTGEGLMRFSFETWGVQFDRVCHLPPGWRITAGMDATPDGELSGSGSHGATWFNDRNPAPLRNLVLVTLHGPMQREKRDGSPATFEGEALISTADGERKERLTTTNIRLTPAKACPAR